MLRLAFDFIITWRETRTRPNAYVGGMIAFGCIAPIYSQKCGSFIVESSPVFLIAGRLI